CRRAALVVRAQLAGAASVTSTRRFWLLPLSQLSTSGFRTGGSQIVRNEHAGHYWTLVQHHLPFKHQSKARWKRFPRAGIDTSQPNQRQRKRSAVGVNPTHRRPTCIVLG